MQETPAQKAAALTDIVIIIVFFPLWGIALMSVCFGQAMHCISDAAYALAVAVLLCAALCACCAWARLAGELTHVRGYKKEKGQ